ncbi:Uncharacterized protein PBTT_09152 [Plasmodiophora brassicae]
MIVWVVVLVAAVAAMTGAAFDHHGRIEEHRPVHVKVDQLVSATHARASARSTAEALRELEQNLVEHIVHNARVVLEGPIQEPLQRAEHVAAQVLHQTQKTWEAVATGAKSSRTASGGDPGPKADAITRELADLRDGLGRLLHQSQRTMWMDPALSSSSSASSPWIWVHTSWAPLLIFEAAFLVACAALRMASRANTKQRHRPDTMLF